MDAEDRIGLPLREATQLTEATWAALAERVGGSWIVRAAHRLSKPAQVALARLLERPSVDAWLCGALTGGHSRSGALPQDDNLGSGRFFAFPISGSSRALVVGAPYQSAEAQRVWKLTASLLALPSAPQPGGYLPDLQIGLPYDLPLALDRVLGYFVRAAAAQGAWIAIRRGDSLEIHAEWNNPKAKGVSLEFDAYPALRRLRRTRSEIALTAGQTGWEELPQAPARASANVWICLPLVIGQRLIGAVALWRQKDLERQEWQNLRDLAVRLAPVAEVNVTFSEMAAHLRRLAMLNDFMLSLSSAQTLDQITRRAFGLLARVFGTEQIALYLLSSDAQFLREFGSTDGRLASRIVVSAGHPIAAFLEQGHVQRISDIPKSSLIPVHADSRSALIVPLKYRGQMIGLVSIEHTKSDAFSQFDEHLMVVIAGHLAGLIEYGRLREEAEGRARSLGLIHEVVQQIIGLTNKAEVAQITADLLAQYFRYELAAVVLLDNGDRLTIQGIGGARGEDVRRALAAGKFSIPSGITGHVFSTGESLLVNDTKQNPYYEALKGWEAGSEMCVALREGERVLGIIDVESAQQNAFSHHDLVSLESLAGILASVVSSADHHQRLQSTVNKLRVTETELKTRMDSLQAAENQLVQAAKLAAVGEMAAGIAHELNNPLTTVTGFSELMLDEMSAGAPNRGELEMVLREARRASDVVRRLLDFSRQGERTRASGDLNEIVEDVIALTNHLIRTNGATLRLQLDPGIPWVSVDRNQMKQVVLNLIHNALQAMPGGGQLEIGSEQRSRAGRRWVVCWIRDTGMGIQPADQGKIFEPFFTTRAAQGGTGLGLSVTYGIVADHGGTIDVESDLGNGTTFTVWLPL